MMSWQCDIFTKPLHTSAHAEPTTIATYFHCIVCLYNTALHLFNFIVCYYISSTKVYDKTHNKVQFV